MNMGIKVLSAVAKEIRDEPQELKESVFGVLERLEHGETIPIRQDW